MQRVRKESKSSQGLQLQKTPRPHAFWGRGAEHLTLFIYFYSLTCVLAGGLQSSRAVAFSSYRTPQRPCLVSRTERPSCSFICGCGGGRVGGEQASWKTHPEIRSSPSQELLAAPPPRSPWVGRCPEPLNPSPQFYCTLNLPRPVKYYICV